MSMLNHLIACDPEPIRPIYRIGSVFTKNVYLIFNSLSNISSKYIIYQCTSWIICIALDYRMSSLNLAKDLQQWRTQRKEVQEQLNKNLCHICPENQAQKSNMIQNVKIFLMGGCFTSFYHVFFQLIWIDYHPILNQFLFHSNTFTLYSTSITFRQSVRDELINIRSNEPDEGITGTGRQEGCFVKTKIG